MSRISELLPGYTASSVFDIDYKKLYAMGYRGLMFDIDNTLVHHGDDSTPEVDALFKRIHDIGFSVLMLSNNSEERILRFLKNIDALYIADAQKPDPASYEKALDMLGLKRNQVVMIGDQLFTDIRGANRCGIDSICVNFIRLDSERWYGWHRYMEFAILSSQKVYRKAARRPGPSIDRDSSASEHEMASSDIIHKGTVMKNIGKFLNGEILFCDISPAAYKLSEQKENVKKALKDLRGNERYARDRRKERLPYAAASSCSNMIKRAPGVDLTLQQNKAVNISLASRTFNHLVIHPGETFSFWKNVGKTTEGRGYLDGRVIRNGRLIPGTGGGLCNLANTIHLLVRNTPLTVTELHTHSDALAPDEGPRKPFANGTSVSYSSIDFRFRNDTDQDFQIIVFCKGEMLYAQLRCEHAFPYTYKITEEDHHFHQEGDKYYRVSRIYHETYDKESGKLLKRELIRDNHSEVMFDPSLIDPELIR